jgi:hypothetical protein
MTVTTDRPPTFPPGRYGRRRSPTPAAKPLVAVLAVVIVAVMVLIGVRLYRAYGDHDYTAEVTRFTTSESAVDVEFTVRLPAGGKAECIVRARNAAGAEVGRATVPVSAGADPSRTVAQYRLVTQGRPVTGEITGCGPVAAP